MLKLKVQVKSKIQVTKRIKRCGYNPYDPSLEKGDRGGF